MRRTAPILLVVAVALLIGCNGRATVDGTVVDGDGTPIQGATISLWREGDEVGSAKSDSKGGFLVGGKHKATRDGLCLLTQKRGFADDNRQLIPNRSHKGLRIVMEQQAFIID